MITLDLVLHYTHFCHDYLLNTYISDDFFLLNTENWPISILHREIYCSIQKQQKKMIGPCTHFRENDNLPP